MTQEGHQCVGPTGVVQGWQQMGSTRPPHGVGGGGGWWGVGGDGIHMYNMHGAAVHMSGNENNNDNESATFHFPVDSR